MVCPGCDMKLMDFAGILRNTVKWKDFLVSHGIFRQSVACPTCGDIRHLVIARNDRCYYRCNKRHGKVQRCNFERSARQGSFVGGSKLSVEQILNFCALWCLLPNPRYRVLREETNISKKTATDWSIFCREVCLGWVYDNRRQIGGSGNVVEIHESKFGPQKYNRDKRIEGQWVFWGVERGNAGNFFLVPVQNRNAETLVEIIRQWILPGTTIASDCWRAYKALQNEDFQQLRLDHSLEIIDTTASNEIHIEENLTRPAGETLPIPTQDIEKKLLSVKNSMPVFGRKKEHLEGYFAEYIFKSNFPRSRLLCEFFKRAALMYPPQP
ncbi:uncharacterized protein [Periplaneta americana]|uniref:uncharacterized protein isoform X1 n=1 Tax=Periplaneta americana TaxID=6978 RepID=UPI0037E829C9